MVCSGVAILISSMGGNGSMNSLHVCRKMMFLMVTTAASMSASFDFVWVGRNSLRLSNARLRRAVALMPLLDLGQFQHMFENTRLLRAAFRTKCHVAMAGMVFFEFLRRPVSVLAACSFHSAGK